MARSWPALDVRGIDRSDLVLALLDDFEPTAVEERESSLRAFFGSSRARDAARAMLAERYSVEPVDLPDEDWARRSQEDLTPVTVGRITILPGTRNPTSGTQYPTPGPRRPASGAPQPFAIVIAPSMGFGTGHHATTRLCLRAMQTLDFSGSAVLDAGTGSGILAIAAGRLGAREVLGIDNDPDAVQAARENLLRNPDVRHVVFEAADLTRAVLPHADIVTANLTGALISRAAAALVRPLGRTGTLILSGLLAHERAHALAAFDMTAPIDPIWEAGEDEWLCIVLRTGWAAA